MSASTADNAPRAVTAWSPLAYPVFRSLWLAALASNVGSLMQGVAAAWLMTSLTDSPAPVALLVTAVSLPLFLVGLPAGALADVVERRRLVIWTQVWMSAIAAVLAAVAFLGWMTPALLLGLTFLLGLGGAVAAPAWQAIVPQLVPRQQLPSAIALNGAGFNLARAIGPALGGLIVAAASPVAVFAINALSYLGVILVLSRWQAPPPEQRSGPPERVGSAVVAGLRYARHSPPLRAVLARTAAFITFASALWALLPVVAEGRLGLSSIGYGILLAALGLGAVGGAFLMPRLRDRFSGDALVSIMTLVFAAGTLALAYLQNLWLISAALVFVGIAWLVLTSSLNVAAQTTTPGWVQARALGVYLLVFQGGFAGGSALWGMVADRFGDRVALVVAAALLVVGIVAAFRWRLLSGEEMDLSPSQHWPEPQLEQQPEPDEGPVLVMVEYRVEAAKQDEFSDAMQDIQVIRLRDGASHWGLFRDAAETDRIVETFVISSWAEHQRQHERITVADRAAQERALALQQPGTSPVVSHFVATGRQNGSRIGV
jgi:MFS family permease